EPEERHPTREEPHRCLLARESESESGSESERKRRERRRSRRPVRGQGPFFSAALTLTPTHRSADQHGLADLPVLAAHLLQDDRMPAPVAFIRGDVILPRPPAELQLLDQVDFG